MVYAIPPAPRPPRADPRELAFFFALDGKFPGVGTLELANPPGWGRKKRANVPSSVNTATFFSLIAQSKSAILSISMCVFLFEINVFLCHGARILIKTSRRDDKH